MLEKCVNVIELSKQKCEQPIRGLLKYAGVDNFLGRSVKGYHPDAADICIMTQQAAHDLCKVQNDLIKKNQLGLIIFDSYRPLRAVQDFNHWMHQPPTGELELQRKQIHYPHLEKGKLDVHGYVNSSVSRHCFGGTVDLSLISLPGGQELNMGAVFDYFGEKSHATQTAEDVGKEAFQNRQVLTHAMAAHGFKVYPQEYWHFDYRTQEVEAPMDFEITVDLKNLGI